MAPDVETGDLERSPLVCLASGVDSLYLSGRVVLAPSVFEELELLRAEAAASGSPGPGPAGWEGWRVAEHSFGRYRFCLLHERGRLGVTSSERLPTLRFQPVAEALHGLGPVDLVAWIDGLVTSAWGPVHWSVSRVDLFSDWQGWDLHGNDRHRFLCRADSRKTYEHGETFTGFEFGSRSSGTLSARIYDKTVDVDKKGTDWWHTIWGAAFDPHRPVHRVEFECNRTLLREFCLTSPAEVLDAAPSLWSYATEWLSFRIPTGDRTPSRWPLAPEWARVRDCQFPGGAIGLERTTAGRRAGSLRKLFPALTGYVSRFAALSGLDDIDDTVAALPAALRDYEVISGVRFRDRVERKRAG